MRENYAERQKSPKRSANFRNKFQEFQQSNQEFVNDRMNLMDKRIELEVMKTYLASDSN